jgi:hypothetical protein
LKPVSTSSDLWAPPGGWGFFLNRVGSRDELRRERGAPLSEFAISRSQSQGREAPPPRTMMSCPSLYCSCCFPTLRCPARLHPYTHGGRGKPASYRRPRPLFHPPLAPLVYADRGQHTERRSHYNSTPYAKSSTGDEQLPATPRCHSPPRAHLQRILRIQERQQQAKTGEV